MQTLSPLSLSGSPDKKALNDAFVGRPISSLRTPALVVDRATFAANCARMHQNVTSWGANFRAHIKTHKTVEGTRLQLVSEGDQTHSIIVSTLMEAWKVVDGGLVSDGIVKDILYGLPVSVNKLDDISALWDEIAPLDAVIRILVDHPDQVQLLDGYEKARPNPRRWSVFVKIDAGYHRAGLSPKHQVFRDLLDLILVSPAISLYGFYCHAGQSYASTTLEEASKFLSAELRAVNDAAEIATSAIAQMNTISSHNTPFVLSVGSTPTAHAATPGTKTKLHSSLHGKLEIHAGNYAMLDLQQIHTSLVDSPRVAQKVLATVISYYPSRGADGTDEALCDAGGIAMSKDTGPIKGYGWAHGGKWYLKSISQEHGVLAQGPGSNSGSIRVGDKIEIIGQHACMIAAAHPWYYIVDSSTAEDADRVVDVWVPCKGW